MNKNNIPFLGIGWAFPPKFNKGKIGLEMSSGAKDIQESLFILLSTKTGERFMTPNFGCDLDEMLFEPLNLDLEKKIEDEIRRAILLFESRISLENIIFEPKLEEGTIFIDIQYIIRTTNTRTNIVYPFYLNEGTNL